MAADDHIFQASGDACPICAALDGSVVPAGFQAHDNCACQTIPMNSGGDEDTCEWTFEQTGNLRDGSGSFDVVSTVEVTVICPDGSATGMTTQVDGHAAADFDDWSERFDEAVEAVAQQLCDDCPKPQPFLCC